MSEDDKATDAKADAQIDASLRKHLAEIEREETPERLLKLATELQRLLRQGRS
ncbi:hypothetical protein [Pararhodobacter zhoushanensis]|uniref:hypothetical protein n=1 Tax=Pararhodobacter zhoushanensis TaxID=2479545 RepID=UPI0013DFD57D|nr:hypothetical protein [Pararhodobacter zhoushanensis]